jgi:hypothetical protein
MKLHRDQMILAVLAGGMALTALEVRVLHQEIVREYWQGWIPIVYGFVAAGFLLAAVSQVKQIRIVAGLVCLVGIPIGMYGVFMHTEGSFRPIQQLFSVTNTVVAKADGGEESESGGGEGGAPPAAPLGITGLATIGALLLLVPAKGLGKSDEPIA